MLTSQLQNDAGTSNVLWDTVGSVLPVVGLGGVLGWSVGYFLKKSLKVGAVVAAMIFVGVQLLAHLGYVTVDFAVMASDFTTLADQDLFDGVWHLLSRNLPFGGGFAAGFALGFMTG